MSNYYKSKHSAKKHRTYVLTKRDIDFVGGLVAEDEEFRPCPHEKAMFISNYARLISTRRKNPRLLKTQFINGYNVISLHTMNHNKYNCNAYNIHRLVAEAFCPIEDWICPDDIKNLQVHHIIAVDKEKEIPSRNYASNLMWVPATLHKVIDRVEQIEVQKNGEWIAMDFVAASEYLNITPYQFFNICGSFKKIPLRIDNEDWEYFSASDCEQEDQSLFRIKRKETKKWKKE